MSPPGPRTLWRRCALGCTPSCGRLRLHDLHQVAKAITEHKVDTRFACLVSDDAHPETLIQEGHLDTSCAGHRRRASTRHGDPDGDHQLRQCFQMDHELGSITPGKCADIVFLNNLEELKVTRVLIDGDVVAEDGRACSTCRRSNSPTGLRTRCTWVAS